MAATAGGVANPVHNWPHPLAPAEGALGRKAPDVALPASPTDYCEACGVAKKRQPYNCCGGVSCQFAGSADAARAATAGVLAPASGNGGSAGRPRRPPPNLASLILPPPGPPLTPPPALAPPPPPRPRPARAPPPPLPTPVRKEKLVRTLSGCGVINAAALERRVTTNTQTLYHVTDAASARTIEESGVMLRGSSNCLFGSGIYFAKTPGIAARKARSAGALVTAEVDLGQSYLPDAGDKSLGFRKLQEMGFDSVHGRAAPLGPLRFHDE